MKRPAFQFYPKDYESDENVKLMSLEQEGAYLRLLCHAWLHGSIPEEVGPLARICRVSRRKMAGLWPGVRLCFEPRDGRLVNPRMERDRADLDAFRRERSESGRRGARSRWGRTKTQRSGGQRSANGSGNGSGTGELMANDGPAVSILLPASGSAKSSGASEEHGRSHEQGRPAHGTGPGAVGGRCPGLELDDADERRRRITAKLGEVTRLALEFRGEHLDELRDVWLEAVPQERQRWRLNLHPNTADHDVLLSAERELDDWLQRLQAYA